MFKDYKEIQFAWGSIEGAVNELLEYRNKDILACIDFNGHLLYSDTVTIDGAYKEITGKTRKEHKKEYQEWKENYERKEQDYKEKIPELTEQWKQRGREVLTEDKWDYWDEIVPIRLGDLYHGMELECCLDIVKILNNGGTLEQAKAEINKQDHSGMSYGLVKLMVGEFCDRGKEFVEYVS